MGSKCATIPITCWRRLFRYGLHVPTRSGCSLLERIMFPKKTGRSNSTNQVYKSPYGCYNTGNQKVTCGGVSRTARNAEQSRRRILEAAAKVFARSGLAGARVDEVAAVAGINKRMLYHYFGNKEGLYLAVLEDQVDRIYRHLAVVFEQSGSTLERIKRGIRTYFYLLAENETVVRLIGWENMAGGRYIRQILPRYLREALPVLRQALRQGIEEGLLRPDLDLNHLLLSIHALCLAYFTRRDLWAHLMGDGAFSPCGLEHSLQHITSLVLYGILRRKEELPGQ